ncbi:MAG: bifunctional chorismate mutase/prephenate dehydratase [Clostridia bacterium]|nr:bifunctional chorismate mutase/prephenate dehydratase [Clostridia bacterium]
MSRIEDLRKEIDAIDDELSALYIKRMGICKEIGKEKAETGTPVNAAAREKEIINRVTKNASDDVKVYLKRLYQDIFFQSKTYQSSFAPAKSPVSEGIREILKKGTEKFPVSATVACQGVAGAYSGIAADKLFEISDVTYFKTFDAVFNAVDKGLCEYGVLPIENSTAGSVSQVYDLMKKHSFYIVKSVRVQITHALLAKKGVKTEDIKTVYSHPQALSQCSEFLKKLGVKTVEVENTAVAAEMVAKGEDMTAAALCSEDCGEINDLAILERGVQNASNNFTRFICISKDLKVFDGADKISVMTSLSNKPGSLNKTLSRFATIGLNLTKLESRPIENSPFEFMFYFDFEGDIRSDSVLDLIAELDNSSDKFVFLGSYRETI